ncbi:muscle M-line assembly protein unc-89-like isoform X2 [Liolophura sinensis]|uniref:muscle M-line assembly protein unc-89-like isoform X2 n=1 Tax=Liolophura sinensis TaxID=3198878 RepID=UPI003158AFD7
MDMENTEKWLGPHKTHKSYPLETGLGACELLGGEKCKKARGQRGETFREDIIKISNKQQEALVKRRYVLTDLLETEREYINQLNSIKECFHDNMFKDRNIPDVLKEKKGVIFGNLKDIQEFHSDVLLPALTNCALNPGTVGKVILNLKDQFEKYIPYGSERDTADFLLSGEDVKKFLKDYNRKSGSEQVLPDCLRRPIARIHEYQAVLKDILKYSCRAGEDSKDIEAAIHMLSEILRRIEDVKLLRTVEGFPGDLSSLGTLIRHGDLQMWDDEPVGKGKDRHMFLFPHKLLLAKPNKDGSGFIHKATCELQDIQVNETVPSDDRMFELWYAEPTSEKLTFQARSVVAKEAWVNQIREALKSLGVEETDIMPEQQRPTKGPKIPTPSRRKSKDTISPEKEVPPPGDSTGEDYLSFESLDSDVSSYHTAPEFEDGTTRPVFKKRLCRTVVKEGDKACLECTVGGIPLPTVAWQKGVYPIKSSDELRIEVQGAWNALVIPETICEDSGVYTAKATNVNGSAVCSAELTVGDGVTDQEYITAQSALSSEGEITLPAKMGQMDSCVVEEGKMARFDCNLVADPKPEIMWLKDGKILTTSKKYEVLNPREDLHSLIVHDVNKDDSGRYVCWARNEFGEAFTEAYLNIIPSAEAESDVERIAPKITKKFYDLVATNGHSAELKFKFIGSPMPHIQWYIKNKEVLPPREFDVKVEGDQCTFTLKEVSMEDAGKIIVKLTNPLGEDRCSAQLTVIEDFSKPRGLPKVAPKFITRFTDVDVNQGFEARFKSKVIGEPIPTVTWLRNGVPLKDCPRYKYEEYGEIFILIIENAEQGDAGEYMCVAKNKAGEASCKANLMVTKVAIPQVSKSESTYRAVDYGRRGQLGISPKRDVKGVNGEMGPQFGYAPVFTKMIQDCDTKEGRRAEFECRAYGMPEPTATWTHNGIPMERGDRFIMSKDEDSNYHLMIKDVLPTDAGQYSCKLANFAGKASCSAELRVEALPRRDPLRLSPERGIDDDLKTLKKAITEPPSMPDQKPVLLDKTPDTVRLSWLPAHVPSKSQGAQPIMYIVESRELPTGDWRRMASMIPTTAYQAKGLNPNSEYLFRVRAENDNGMSEPTTAAVLERRLPKEKTDKEFRLEASPKARKDTIGLSTESMTGPSLPSDRPTLLDIRPESVRIQWVPVTLTGPGADYRPVKYLLEVKEIPGPWRKLASGLTGNSYFATDLNPDREYNFRVRAENKFAESEPTLPATLQKGRVAPGQGRLDPYLLEIPKVPPALPASKPYVSDIGDESLRLSWKPADIPKALKGVSPTSYRIEVQELPKQDWQTLVSYIPDTTYRLTDLRPRQDYNFRIRAENEFGLSEPSRPFYLPRATTYPGAAVTRPDIVELEREAVRLNWQRVEIPQFESDEEPLTYMIEGRTPSSDWRELVRGIRGTSHRLAGLETSEDYSFRVRPDSSTRGLGEPSPPMSLSRALARTRVPVSDLEVEEIEPTSVRLKWDRVHIPPFDSSEEPLLYMIEAQEGPYADWRTVASGVPTTAFRLTDLRPEKDYAFRVRAETEYGISEPSPPKPLYRKPPEAPRYHLEPPRIDSFDAEGLQLSWKPMSPHPRIRRADPPKYTIEMREAPQADWRPVAAGVPDTSFRLTGLRPEQDYTFRVRAEMPRLPEPVALITPAVSLLRGGVPPVMPSSAPTISNEKPNSLRLSWRPANLPSYLTGESGPIRYQVEMLESPSTEWRTLATRHPDLSFEVSRLHPDREYAFRVRAQTESGTSAPTAPAYLYRKPIPHLPKAEPLLSDIRPDSVRLTWQAVDVPGKVTDFQKVLYMIEMQEPPSQTWTPFVRDVHEINHRVQNLRPDKDYVFRVRAVTDQGMSEPTMSVYLPRRAVQPRLPMAEPYISEVKVDSARLSWTPVDTPPFGAQMVPTTYRVEIQEPPNTNWQTLVRKLPTTNYLLTNLRPDNAYCLRVRAENDYGVSEPTRAVQLPRRAVAPVVPSDIPLVTDVRRGSMRLTWQPANVPSYGGSNMTLPVTYTIEAREPGHDWSPLVRRIPHTSYFLSGLKPEGGTTSSEFVLRVSTVSVLLDRLLRCHGN